MSNAQNPASNVQAKTLAKNVLRTMCWQEMVHVASVCQLVLNVKLMIEEYVQIPGLSLVDGKCEDCSVGCAQCNNGKCALCLDKYTAN